MLVSTLAIEAIVLGLLIGHEKDMRSVIIMGKADICIDPDNDWEVYTEDGMPSAQWEIMVLVRETGAEVLCW